ncbi:MAG: hypothetical protein K0V04_34195, partial [Deltaproteobacteria bacterium]|nr:hypothetical protein [Deltaproteobacteria bacterium]
MPHLRIRTALFIGTCVLALGGCDRVQGLFSDAEPEAAAAQPAASESKAEPKAPTEASTPVGGVAAAAAPAAAPAKSPPTEVAGAKPGAAAAQPDAAAEGQPVPCIVGRWDAIEYTEAVRRAIAKDPQLRKLKKTSSGGHITYVLDGETNTVTATA